MTWIIFLLVGFGVGYLLGRRQGRSVGSWGMDDARRREKVLTLFERKAEITNDDVQKIMGISDATATRYLDALEMEGKIVQVGDTGRGVAYRRK